ncbi:hypothetical protein [Amycolatopsis sp. cmx-4-68]|uniref:hypothetical protein n=1 Tax=Amycolatopsis sp. cmx-4-68 TaxID=2790938 RepID=UPI003979C30C
MTDFVHRLLGRPGPAAPPIRPVIASLFEPRRARAAVDAALPLGEVTDSPQATFAVPPAAAAAAPVVAPSPSVPRLTPALPAREPEPPAPRKDGTPVAPEQPEPREEGPLAADAPASAHPVTVEVVLPEPARLPAEPARTSPERPAKTRRGGRAATPDMPSPSAPTPFPAEAGPVRAHPVRPVPAAAREPADVPKPPRPASRRAPAAEPTVHISIGRVEVKAAPQPAPPPARAESPRRPAVSLDDYLRNRAGGERR